MVVEGLAREERGQAMTKARITKRTNTVLARNWDLANHGLKRKPYTIQDIRKLAVALSTGRLLRRKEGG